jgi:hypothetical protein
LNTATARITTARITAWMMKPVRKLVVMTSS